MSNLESGGRSVVILIYNQCGSTTWFCSTKQHFHRHISIYKAHAGHCSITQCFYPRNHSHYIHGMMLLTMWIRVSFSLMPYQFLPSSQFTLPESVRPRILHTTTAINLGLTRTQVTMFGGCPKWWGEEKSLYAKQKLADTTLLEFGEQKASILWYSLIPRPHPLMLGGACAGRAQD